MQVARVVCRMCDSIWPAAATLFAPCLPYRVPLMRRQPSARTDGQDSGDAEDEDRDEGSWLADIIRMPQHVQI